MVQTDGNFTRKNYAKKIIFSQVNIFNYAIANSFFF